MFWLDPALRLTWVNRAWESVTGRTAESVLGRNCLSHSMASDGNDAHFAESFVPPPEALAGQPSGSLTHIVHPDAGTLWKRIEFWPFCDQTGTLLGLLGQMREPNAPPSVPDSPSQKTRSLLLQLREQLCQQFGIESLVGTGPAHRRILEQVRVAAGTTVPVLLIGEPGTGKRLVASAIHHLGVRHGSPLVPFDCQALSAEVLQRELFTARGDENTAQTGTGSTEQTARSRLKLAEGSTMVIGDILALPRDLQSRLAEALEGRVRLIATTTGDPDEALRQGSVLPELYYLMTTLVLKLEPLRRRRNDIALLAHHFLDRANQRWACYCAGFTPAARAVIESYDWPGNLRELARVIDHAHVHARTRDPADAQNGRLMIDVDDLPASIRGNLGAAYQPPAAPRGIKPLDELLTEIERRLIETALTRARQNKSRAAELLGISRPRLYRRIKELNLPDVPEPDAETAAGSSPEPGDSPS